MIRGHCPTCHRAFSGHSMSELPHFPFCSERCRLVDLNRWVEGDYVVSRPLEPDDLDDLDLTEFAQDSGEDSSSSD